MHNKRAPVGLNLRVPLLSSNIFGTGGLGGATSLYDMVHDLHDKFIFGQGTITGIVALGGVGDWYNSANSHSHVATIPADMEYFIHVGWNRSANSACGVRDLSGNIVKVVSDGNFTLYKKTDKQVGQATVWSSGGGSGICTAMSYLVGLR